MNVVSGILVVAFGLCLLGFSALVAVKPLVAELFVQLFASSARAHYTEQLLRLVVGMAIVFFRLRCGLPMCSRCLGGSSVITTVVLLLVPRQWHHRFAGRMIPLVKRYLKLYAVGAFLLGSFIICGASRSMFS
jgi:hypothetical protein